MCPMWLVYFIFKYFLMIAPLWVLSFGFVGAAAEVMSNSSVKKGTFNPATMKQLLMGSSETARVCTFENSKLLRLISTSLKMMP